MSWVTIQSECDEGRRQSCSRDGCQAKRCYRIENQREKGCNIITKHFLTKSIERGLKVEFS